MKAKGQLIFSRRAVVGQTVAEANIVVVVVRCIAVVGGKAVSGFKIVAIAEKSTAASEADITAAIIAIIVSTIVNVLGAALVVV